MTAMDFARAQTDLGTGYKDRIGMLLLGMENIDPQQDKLTQRTCNVYSICLGK
jgi:hypothetical protein